MPSGGELPRRGRGHVTVQGAAVGGIHRDGAGVSSSASRLVDVHEVVRGGAVEEVEVQPADLVLAHVRPPDLGPSLERDRPPPRGRRRRRARGDDMVVMTRAPPRPTFSAIVRSSWSTVPRVPSRRSTKLTKMSSRVTRRRSDGVGADVVDVGLGRHDRRHPGRGLGVVGRRGGRRQLGVPQGLGHRRRVVEASRPGPCPGPAAGPLPRAAGCERPPARRRELDPGCA